MSFNCFIEDGFLGDAADSSPALMAAFEGRLMKWLRNWLRGVWKAPPFSSLV